MPLFRFSILAGLSAVVAALWAVYGLPGLLGLTSGLVDFCQSLFVRCIAYADIIKIALIWSGVALVTGGLAYGSGKALLNAMRAGMALKRLPLIDRGLSVVLIKDSGRQAFTHGLLKPRIYISTGLIDDLDREELKAVFLHELHHRQRLDPLRFFLLNLTRDSFFYIPVLAHAIGVRKARGEHDADDRAAAGASHLSLASALVKVASGRTAFAVSINGSTPVADRVKRLVAGREVRFPRPSVRAVVLSVIMAVFVTAALVLPINAGVVECTESHCSTHIKELGSQCRTHCSTGAGAHKGHGH